MTHTRPMDEDGGPHSDPPSSAPPAFVFPPGVDKLDEDTLMALSPRDIVWSHRSTVGLADALIMMVDDEQLNIEMTEAFLMEAGYTNFVNTDDSREAIAMMRARPPAVLLLDLSMPHVSGVQILEAMRQDKQLRHIPVIVLTATTEALVKLQCLAMGAMDFLSKPVDPSELALRLRNTLAASAYRDFLAEHDVLTGLPNKVRYRKFAVDVLAACLGSGWSGALVHVGVDGLGPINDAMGRSVGDQILIRLAKRLASSVETEVGGELGTGTHEPALFRFDGDEFAIVLPHVESQASAAGFISRLLDDAVCAFSRGGQEVFATSSMGIVMFPQDGNDAIDLMTKASLTMRKAKEGGAHRYEFFTPRFNDAAASRMSAAVELRRAFNRQEIEMRYEPRLDADQNRLVGACAVAFWERAGGQAIFGDDLVDLAAETDVGRMLADWSIEQVQRTLATWKAAGVSGVPVRLALSLSQVSASDMLLGAKKAVREGLDPSMVVMVWQQIPAMDAMNQRELDAFVELARLGFRLALSRFGAGQSSLQMLSRLPLSEVQLDPSLIHGYARSPQAAALFEAAVKFVRDLGLICVVPGVENLQQHMVLRKAGAHHYQGPLIDPPLKAADFAVKRLILHKKQGG